MNLKVFPQGNCQIYEEKLINLKKKILSNIEQNLDNYQIFKINHKDEFDFILVKKNSIHDNVLKTTLKVNEKIHL